MTQSSFEPKSNPPETTKLHAPETLKVERNPLNRFSSNFPSVQDLRSLPDLLNAARKYADWVEWGIFILILFLASALLRAVSWIPLLPSLLQLSGLGIFVAYRFFPEARSMSLDRFYSEVIKRVFPKQIEKYLLTGTPPTE